MPDMVRRALPILNLANRSGPRMKWSLFSAQNLVGLHHARISALSDQTGHTWALRCNYHTLLFLRLALQALDNPLLLHFDLIWHVMLA